MTKHASSGVLRKKKNGETYNISGNKKNGDNHLEERLHCRFNVIILLVAA